MDEVLHCKKCGKEILKGKYCRICKEERKATQKKLGVRVAIVLGGIATIVTAIFSIIPVIIGIMGKIFAGKRQD